RFGRTTTPSAVLAGLVTRRSGIPDFRHFHTAQLGQARVAVPSTYLLRSQRKTSMPAQASLRSLVKLGCERGHDEKSCERALLLENIGELRLELARVDFDVVIVDRERVDRIEPRQSFRRRHGDAGGKPPFLRELALYLEHEVELCEQLGRVWVRRALDDRAGRRHDD